jgi:hypothetical protein
MSLKNAARLTVTVAILGGVGMAIVGQAPAHPPVIDVHVHSANTTPEQALERMKQLNIRYLVVSTLVADFPRWASVFGPNQFAPGLVLPCDHGRAIHWATVF